MFELLRRLFVRERPDLERLDEARVEKLLAPGGSSAILGISPIEAPRR